MSHLPIPLSQRAAMLDGDLDSDVRMDLENGLARGVDRLLGSGVNGLDLVDAVIFKLVSRLTPETIVRLAERTDAIEALRRAGDALMERHRAARPGPRVIPFRPRERRVGP